MSARFLHFKVTIYPPLEGSHYAHPTLTEQGTMLHGPWSGRIHKLFGTVLHGRCVSSHLFISVWTHEYLFYTLGYNPVFCCSNCSIFGHWKFFQLVLISLWHIPSIVGSFFWALPYFLVTTRYSRLILYISCPSHSSPTISHFSQEPCSFYWRMVLQAMFLS